MKLFASLQNRIFVASALVAVLSTAFTLDFVTRRVSREGEAELERGLRRAKALLEENHTARLATLTLLARLIADLPKLKAAVETGDPPTVEPLARDYQSRVRSDLFVVAGPRGDVLSALGASPDAVRGLSFAGSPAAGPHALTLRTDERVVEVVSVPIALGPDPPEVVGTLSLGFALDDALASRFKAVTDSEVAFALGGRLQA